MASPFEKRIDGILKNSLTPLLKPQGFRKSGRIYRAQRDDIIWLVNVEMSLWNDKDQAQFTVSGGVYVPGIVGRYLNKPEPARPTLGYCCVSVRMGMLDESRLDKWWELTWSGDPNEADKQIAAELSDRVENLLLPFLGTFNSPEGVAAYLLAPRTPDNRFVSPQDELGRRIYAALIYARQGNTAKAREEIDRAAREAEGSPIEEFVRRVRESLVTG